MSDTDIRDNDFEAKIWCDKFDKYCDDITHEEQKGNCIGCCTICLFMSKR